MPQSLRVHRATSHDLDSLRQLCAEALANRATLSSARRDWLDPAAWLSARAPLVLVRDGTGAIGFAGAISGNAPLGAPRCAEAFVFVTAAQRRRGAARAAMNELLSAARTLGLWKLLAYALPEDAAARALATRLDFREVGTLVKHVQLEGGYKDVVLCERLVLAMRKSAPSLPNITE